MTDDDTDTDAAGVPDTDPRHIDPAADVAEFISYIPQIQRVVIECPAMPSLAIAAHHVGRIPRLKPWVLAS